MEIVCVRLELSERHTSQGDLVVSGISYDRVVARVYRLCTGQNRGDIRKKRMINIDCICCDVEVTDRGTTKSRFEIK